MAQQSTDKSWWDTAKKAGSDFKDTAKATYEGAKEMQGPMDNSAPYTGQAPAIGMAKAPVFGLDLSSNMGSYSPNMQPSVQSDMSVPSYGQPPVNVEQPKNPTTPTPQTMDDVNRQKVRQTFGGEAPEAVINQEKTNPLDMTADYQSPGTYLTPDVLGGMGVSQVGPMPEPRDIFSQLKPETMSTAGYQGMESTASAMGQNAKDLDIATQKFLEKPSQELAGKMQGYETEADTQRKTTNDRETRIADDVKALQAKYPQLERNQIIGQMTAGEKAMGLVSSFFSGAAGRPDYFDKAVQGINAARQANFNNSLEALSREHNITLSQAQQFTQSINQSTDLATRQYNAIVAGGDPLVAKLGGELKQKQWELFRYKTMQERMQAQQQNAIIQNNMTKWQYSMEVAARNDPLIYNAGNGVLLRAPTAEAREKLNQNETYAQGLSMLNFLTKYMNNPAWQPDLQQKEVINQTFQRIMQADPITGAKLGEKTAEVIQPLMTGISFTPDSIGRLKALQQEYINAIQANTRANTLAKPVTFPNPLSVAAPTKTSAKKK